MVVSGINAGANMGDDTIYSGTVAAATEGYLLGIPAIAISLVIGPEKFKHYETAGAIAAQLVAMHQKTPLQVPILLNVNVPDVPLAEIKGFQLTRLGKRHKAEPVIKAINPRGETVYWVGAAGAAAEAGPGTDFYAVANNYVSITPLQVDLTNGAQMDSTGLWLSGLASPQSTT